MTCNCIRFLVENGYLQPNLLQPVQFFIYPITKGGKRIVSKPLLVKHCPNCGQIINEQETR